MYMVAALERTLICFLVHIEKTSPLIVILDKGSYRRLETWSISVQF